MVSSPVVGCKILVTFIRNEKAMIRKILVPQERKLVLELPEEFIGKEVEVLAFELRQKEDDIDPSTLTKEERIAHLKKKLEPFTTDMSEFKFDRNEANDYE